MYILMVCSTLQMHNLCLLQHTMVSAIACCSHCCGRHRLWRRCLLPAAAAAASRWRWRLTMPLELLLLNIS